MTISNYRDFILVADHVQTGDNGRRQFEAQVFSSPAGEGQAAPRPIPRDLTRQLWRLENRRLDVAGIIALGEALADLLLPDQARRLFSDSLSKLLPNQGLRLRLRLAPVLAHMPWELMYIQRGEGEKDATGFLALDPRISIVRHEALPVSGDLDTTPRTRRLLAVLASPEAPGFDPLDLARERSNIEQAVEDTPGLDLQVLQDATIQELNDQLQQGADIFHFAGHGQFRQTGLGESIKSIVGQGEIVLVDQNDNPEPVEASQLAVNLQGHGVQLAVLGACQTGRRDEKNVWSGVVAALMEAGIPAAVAMQYKIWDDAAIAFSRSFYRALAAGQLLDQAVSAGRIAAFNLCHPLRNNPERGRFWRDWAVPVLYLRSEQDFVLPAIEDADQRQAVADELRIVVDHRFDEIGPAGQYRAIEAGVIQAGTIESYLKVGAMKGKVEQITADSATSGDIKATGEADVVEGDWTAVRIGSVGGPATTGSSPSAAQPPASGQTCPNCGHAVQPDVRFCANCGQALPAGPRFCSNCGAELTAGANFCGQCGSPTA